MQAYVDRAYRENCPFDAQLSRYFEQYEKLLTLRVSSRGSFLTLLHRSCLDILNELSEARICSSTGTTKYAAFAMGVGATNTSIEMQWYHSNYMNGGGNLLGIQYKLPSHTFIVPVIQLSNWIKDSFSTDDFIYIKMDIEGMEFQVLEDLISTGCLAYIDEMDIEWHGRFNIPGREREPELRTIIKTHDILLRDHY
jgi:FkbM family methyltransferase